MNSKFFTSMRKYFICVSLSTVTLLSVSACSSFTTENTSKADKTQSTNVVNAITEGQFGYVHLEKIESGAAQNDHPYNINEEDLKTVLAKLQVKALSVDEPLFSDAELNDIARSISQGLLTARPDQDITFAVVGKHSGSRYNTATSGRLFIQNGQLNIIFNEIRGEFEPQFRSLGIVRPFLPGSRNNTSPVAVSTGADINHPSDSRRDWVMIAANAIPNTAPVARTQPRVSPAATSNVTPVPVVVPNVARAPAVTPNINPTPVAPSTSAPTNSYQDIEKRLTFIKDLKQKGLITEQEYDQKRKEILKNL